ncbi:hypothetical protein CFIO01_00096 [Colletotrichum fioriniae PJ7]|uniref:Trichothecene 3-O-acetyltransferase n=1 Tax=Colletotrichum fioriniae PJ7 TaxID=1445577 RepID=A0A010S6N5_9PEZI|nr:hypothetical protein CFIO01_00096 [Colletotrichum fioriniae PJ7]
MLSFQFLYRLVPTMGIYSTLLRGRVEFESGCQQQQQQHQQQHQQKNNKKKTTPKVDVYNLHPTGWESDPEDEYHRLCTLDYCSGTIYCAYALFFKLDPGADKHRIVEVLKQGLEITLSQCRRLCGTLREDPDGGSGLCFHKRRGDTVEFHVQWLDGSNNSHGDDHGEGDDDDDDDDGEYPSYADFERQHFSTRAFGPDLNLWCVPPMTPAEKPSNRPENNPKAASFKASFIPGDGLVLMMMHHHLANDVNGWAGELHQLAENCAAIWAASASGADADASAGAAAADGGGSCGGSFGGGGGGGDATSTTAAAAAAPPELPPRLCDASGKPMPARTQGNVIAVAIASRSTHAVPQFTIKEVVEEAPFTKLAWYIRQLTNSITPTTIDAMLSGIARVRNKLTLYAGSDVFPPTTLLVTDWRDADPYTADFGFGRPSGFRCPWDSVTGGLVVIYPPRPADTGMRPGGEDEGNEISLAVEKELVWDLLADPAWNRVFEFRGVEVEDE